MKSFFKKELTKEEQVEVLSQIEDVLRSRPQEQMHTEAFLAWLARGRACLERFDTRDASKFEMVADMMLQGLGAPNSNLARLNFLLQKAKQEIVGGLQTSLTVSIDTGQTYEYYDTLRKKLDLAQSEIFFIDPYLDAEVVSNYIAPLRPTLSLRLLTSNNKIKSLKPAVDMLIAQDKRPITVKISEKLHDRFVILDTNQCFQSGSSFKDGARNAPSLISEIIDPAAAIYKTYNDIWTELPPL